MSVAMILVIIVNYDIRFIDLIINTKKKSTLLRQAAPPNSR